MQNADSIFFKETQVRKFPVSLLAIEVYANAVKEEMADEEIFDVIVDIISKICHVKSIETEHIDYFIDRLKLVEKEIGRSLSGKKPMIGKTFGSSYLDFLNSLSLDSMLLRMTGYDMDQARYIYCEVDRDDSLKMIKEHMTGDLEMNTVQYEAAVYGQGGKYKDDKGKSSAGQSYDLETREGKAALRATGLFGTA